MQQAYDTMSEASQMTLESSQASQISTTRSVPIQPSTTTFVRPIRGGTSWRQIHTNDVEDDSYSEENGRSSFEDYEAQGFSTVSQSLN